MKLVLMFLVMVFSQITMATVTTGTENCPVHFEGRVKEIIDPVGPSDFFSTNRVIFENHQTLKGDAQAVMLVDILENGPFKVEADKSYRVQLRNGRLCWIEEI